MTIRLTRNHLIAAGAALLLVLGLGCWFAFAGAYPGMKSEVESTIAAVGKHMYLPEDEVPTVATVTDLEALKGQPFFAKAEIGHRVLIYTKHRRVILYDPEEGKIVEVAPLTIEPGTE